MTIELTDAEKITPNYAVIFINTNSGLVTPIRFYDEGNYNNVSLEIISKAQSRQSMRFFDGESYILFVPDSRAAYMARIMTVKQLDKEQNDARYAQMQQQRGQGRH